jgi:hypothetical protein
MAGPFFVLVLVDARAKSAWHRITQYSQQGGVRTAVLSVSAYNYNGAAEQPSAQHYKR